MIEAYCEMHRLGHAHCIEVWLPSPSGRRSAVAERGVGGEGELATPPHPNPLPKGEGAELVGGIYGIAIGGLFAAESMFHCVPDASKVALVHLVAHLRSRGFQLLDIQQWTPHTGRMGAIEVPRLEYLRRLASAIELPVSFGESLELEVSPL
jgi:Leu/Phe-tRNA-protein transferase